MALSEYHYNEETYIKEEVEKCNNPCNDRLSGKAILRCNRGVFDSENVVTFIPPFVQTFNQIISNVTIDSTCLHCPKILVEFSGTLTNEVQSVGSFVFTLFKTCKEKSIPQALATFNYNQGNHLGFNSHTIKFKYSSDDDQCDKCCTYTLELTSISNIFSNFFRFSINGMLCVLAVDSQHNNFR